MTIRPEPSVADALDADALDAEIRTLRLRRAVLRSIARRGSDPQELNLMHRLARLSAREREVMRLIARGYSYREVASELFISIKTVETHVSAVLRKLQLSSRHELTRWAAARRLL